MLSDPKLGEGAGELRRCAEALTWRSVCAAVILSAGPRGPDSEIPASRLGGRGSDRRSSDFAALPKRADSIRSIHRLDSVARQPRTPPIVAQPLVVIAPHPWAHPPDGSNGERRSPLALGRPGRTPPPLASAKT